MVACVLLDREARSVILDADPSYGSMKEPLLKVTGIMRSMEFDLHDDVAFVRFNLAMSNAIGQMAHEIPSVFSFFLPEYKPPGPLAQASLVAPEGQVTSGPRIIGLVNGLMSLVKYGLDNCHGGFGVLGDSPRCFRFVAGQYDLSDGHLTYLPSAGGSARTVVDELATLMTSGRLSAESRSVVEQVVSSETNQAMKLIKAQQLIVASPEFHATGLVRKSGERRPEPSALPASSEPYKAVIYLLLSGGVDSFNMLIPHTCTTTSNGKTLLEQYYSERTSVAVTEEERSRIIDASGQACEQFAIHEDLEIIERLYKAGDLSFFANTGVITNPVTKDNYNDVTKTQLFAHNTMQQEARKVDPLNGMPGTGVLGRMCDVLTDKGFNAKPITIDSASIATVGVPGAAVDPLFVSSGGTSTFNPKPLRELFDPRPFIDQLNDATELQSSVFGETWSQQLNQALFDNQVIAEALSSVDLVEEWIGNGYTDRMRTVSSLILSHTQRGTDRDVVYVEFNNWDHHSVSILADIRCSGSTNKALTFFDWIASEAILVG
jgi:uncharacterized protein (DUF1501 family)